jgi:hypothetical protein
MEREKGPHDGDAASLVRIRRGHDELAAAGLYDVVHRLAGLLENDIGLPGRELDELAQPRLVHIGSSC